MRHAILLPLLLAAAPALAEPVTVTDAAGITLSFDAPRERPFCILSECLAGLAGLGLRPHSVWGDIYSDPENGALVHYWGEQAAEIIVVPYADDFENIAAVEPDLILMYDYERAAFETFAPFYEMHFNIGDPLAQGRADMEGFAALLGVPADEAEAKISALEARIAAYEALSPKDRSVVILMNFGAEADEGAFSVMGSACSVLERFAPCPQGTPAEYFTTINAEGLLALDPDFLLIEPAEDTVAGRAAADEALGTAGANPLWTELAAVRAGSVQPMPYVLRPTHLLSTAEWLDHYMPAIYPETFPTPLTDDQVAAALGN